MGKKAHAKEDSAWQTAGKAGIPNNVQALQKASTSAAHLLSLLGEDKEKMTVLSELTGREQCVAVDDYRHLNNFDHVSCLPCPLTPQCGDSMLTAKAKVQATQPCGWHLGSS